MMPTEPESGHPQGPAGVDAPPPVTLERVEYRWYHKMSAVLLITFCLEVGLFLTVFPWTDYWESNYFATLLPQIHQYWDNLYVRGAISGLGLINLYISLVEVFRLRRFAKR